MTTSSSSSAIGSGASPGRPTRPIGARQVPTEIQEALEVLRIHDPERTEIVELVEFLSHPRADVQAEAVRLGSKQVLYL